MKVLAINGSPRPEGNTSILLKTTLDECESAGHEVELVQLGKRQLSGCIACFKCMERKDGTCAITTDCLNELVGKMKAADAIVLGSPTYFSNVTAPVKALIDRAGLVAKANGGLFRRKVGAAVVAVRRAGALHAFNSINHFFFISEMVVPGSSYWNLGVGREPGDVHGDAEGLETMTTLGRNMAWLLGKLGE